MDSRPAAPAKRRSSATSLIFTLLFVLIATGIAYVLTVNASRGNLFAGGSTPLGEAILANVQRTVTSYAGNPFSAALVLAAACLVGGLHALLPGHNKTITGAYLVGTRASYRHALLIGLATALSHTASSVVIGILALSSAGQIASTQYLRWVGLPSGLLTVGLGGWLLWRHLRHGGEHSRESGRLHEHTHDHDHHHDHADPDKATLGGLVALGLAHGLIPTFDALAILLVALNIGQLAFGLGLIAAYSLGIAAVLTAVGVLFIRAQLIILDHPAFQAVSRRTPGVAAAVVIVLGLWLLLRTAVAFL